MKLNKDSPCICKHKREEHYREYCTGLGCRTKVVGGYIELNNPHYFRLDNLRYLEQKYEKASK